MRDLGAPSSSLDSMMVRSDLAANNSTDAYHTVQDVMTLVPGFSVALSPGTYKLDQNFIFGSNDAGTPTVEIKYDFTGTQTLWAMNASVVTGPSTGLATFLNPPLGSAQSLGPTENNGFSWYSAFGVITVTVAGTLSMSAYKFSSLAGLFITPGSMRSVRI